MPFSPAPEAIPITLIAKDFGWSANRMNKFLHAKNIQYYCI